MPLYFTDQKKRWPPSKPVQYFLAGMALVLAVGILIGWLLLRFVYTDDVQEPPKSTTTTSATQIESELPDTGYCLFIVKDAGYEHFALIRFAPAQNAVTVQGIPSTLPISGTETVAQLYQRTKEANVTNAIATYYQLPLKHYISLSIQELESLVSRWTGSIQLTLAEEITYRDENGVTVRIPATASTLTPKQMAATLRYTQWKNDDSQSHLSAELTVALLRYVLNPNRDLNKCYMDIADNTSLLIQHFNAYYPGLAHLAAQDSNTIIEQGTICTP